MKERKAFGVSDAEWCYHGGEFARPDRAAVQRTDVTDGDLRQRGHWVSKVPSGLQFLLSLPSCCRLKRGM